MSEDQASPATLSAAPPLGVQRGSRLSIMMFLQYAIWGAWLPLLWPFLSGHRGFESQEIGTMFAVGAVGAIFAPFIAGQIADRWFPTQIFLGISHIIGGLLVWQLAHLETYNEFLWFSLAYSVLYSPTLPLTNSLTFHHIPDRDRDFGRVRVWGTVGWVAAGIGIGQWLAFNHTPETGTAAEILKVQQAGMADAFKLSGILGVLMGIYCFFLPHTPPAKGAKKNATFEARSEVQRNGTLMALFLFSVIVSCIHQFYFVHTAGFLGAFQAESEGAGNIAKFFNNIFGAGGGGLMTVGQISEIAVLALIPLVAKRLSRKSLLTIGLLAYAARMALFAYYPEINEKTGIDPTLILILGVAMHGLCFGCFIFVAFMVVDEETTADVRASAQSLYNLVIIGIGIIVGSKIAAGVADMAIQEDDSMDYQHLFAVPMWAAILTTLVFIFLYPGGKRKPAAPD